jgi:predicted ester cyclase
VNDQQSSSEAVVREWFGVFNTGDYTVLERIHSNECHNHAPGPFDVSEWPAQGRPFGVGEIRGTIEWIRSNQPDVHVDVEHVLVDRDQAVAWVRATGTPTGAGGPIPATGRPINFAQAHRFRLENGRIVEHWAVRDDLRSMIQAGVIQQPGASPS